MESHDSIVGDLLLPTFDYSSFIATQCHLAVPNGEIVAQRVNPQKGSFEFLDWMWHCGPLCLVEVRNI